MPLNLPYVKISVAKEYRSRSVAVFTPSYGSSPQHIRGIDPIYKMRNIFERLETIFSKLSGFIASAISGSHAKNYEYLF